MPVNNPTEGKLWRLLDQNRENLALTVPAVLKLATESSIRLSPEDLWLLSAKLGGGAGTEGLCPPSVSHLIVGLLDGTEPSSVMDPWVGMGTLLRPVVEALRPKRFLGIHPSEEALDGARIILPPGTAGEYRLGNVDGGGLHTSDEFDVIVAALPFGQRRSPFTIDGIEIRDDGGNELMLRCALRLRPTGVAIFVVPPSFFFSRSRNSVAASLHEFGLYVDASFLLPSGTFRPLTNIESYLVVLRRGEAPEKMFVAQAPSGTATTNTLLANYKTRSAAKEPELGALVDRAEFLGLRQLVSARRLERETKRVKLPAVRLADICTSITRCSRDRGDVKDVDNSFFMPLVGMGNCRLGVNALPEKSGNWVQMEVNPRLADAKIVAGYFNGALGRLIVESQVTGATIPSLRLSSMQDLPVYLPDIAKQGAIIEIDQKLRSLSEEVEGLRTQLWRRLDKAEEVVANANRVNREDTFPLWLDTLPFPLASILWTYHTQTGEPLKRYSQMDFFFEGLAQFLAVLVLSAVRRDEVAFPGAWKTVQSTLEKSHMSLERATLGTWVTVFEGLAKVVRKDLTDPDSAKHWQRLFACDDRDLLAGLVGKKMVTLLKSANSLRNGWRGHGGVVGDDEAHRRELLYLDLLLDFRGIIENRWESYPLVLPRSGRYSQGVHKYSVEHVVGTRTPFGVSDLAVKEPMEDGELHMAAPELAAACPLIPLVHLGASPANKGNACYFFNRVEANGLKFVSYHYIDKPEMVQAFDGARRALAELSE